jgi:hypothetical protein
MIHDILSSFYSFLTPEYNKISITFQDKSDFIIYKCDLDNYSFMDENYIYIDLTGDDIVKIFVGFCSKEWESIFLYCK